MRISAAPLVIASAVLALGATQAFADAPKFHAADSSVSSGGALVVSFDERGLGNENVDYALSARADATWACINKGGKNPSASNKRSVSSPVLAGASFEPRNGRAAGSILAGPPGPGSSFTCPGGQRLVLAAVKYTDIVLRDTTNGVSTSVADASRTFFDV
jgi:hypothetical protein